MMLLMEVITVLVCKITSFFSKKMWYHGTNDLTSVTNLVKLWTWAEGEVPAVKYHVTWLSRLRKFRHHPDFVSIEQTSERVWEGGVYCSLDNSFSPDLGDVLSQLVWPGRRKSFCITQVRRLWKRQNIIFFFLQLFSTFACASCQWPTYFI